MFLFILFTVLLIIIFEPCCVTSTENGIAVNRTDLTKIMGGTVVEIEVYPFMVSIQRHYIYEDYHGIIHHCGGSLVRADWVLTSAQCLMYKDKEESKTKKKAVSRVRSPKRFSVMAGRTYIEPYTLTDPNRIAALSTHINKYFDPAPIAENMGLMKLVSKYPISNKIQLASLPTDRTEYDNLKPTSCTVIGWGATSRTKKKRRRDAGIQDENMAKSNVGSHYRAQFASYEHPLKFVVQNIIPIDECRGRFGSFWSRSHVSKIYEICLEALKEKGPFRHDFGTPLMCGDKQMGVLSYLDTRPNPDPDGTFSPTVASRTDFYLDWIESTISTANALQTSCCSWWMNYAMVLALAVALKQI